MPKCLKECGLPRMHLSDFWQEIKKKKFTHEENVYYTFFSYFIGSYDMCDQVVPSAFYIDDGGITYSTSLLMFKF